MTPCSDCRVDICANSVVIIHRVIEHPLVRLTPASLPLASPCSQTFEGSLGSPESRVCLPGHVMPHAGPSHPSRTPFPSLGQCAQSTGSRHQDHCPSTSGAWSLQTVLTPLLPHSLLVAVGCHLSSLPGQVQAGMTEFQRAGNVLGASALPRGGSRVFLDLGSTFLMDCLPAAWRPPS